MSITSFGVRKPVVANLVMLAIIGAGLVFGLSLRREFFPEVRPKLVTIAAPYPGASPQEVEKSLAIKIEDRIADLRGVKEINTTCVEGGATIMVEFESSVDIADGLARVKREIDALQDLPERSERITVTELEPRIPVISLTLFGGADERTMKLAIDQMREDLRSLAGMGDVLVAGVRRDEISVEVRPAALLEHNLSLPQVAGQVREAMIELPGGAVRSPTRNVSIRTLGAEERAEAVRRIIIKAGPDGRPVRVEDIARVRDAFADVDLLTRLNGMPAVSLTAYARGDQDVVEIAEVVKAYASGRARETLALNLRERLAMLMGGGNSTEPLSPRMEAYELGLSREAGPPGELALHNNISRFVQQRLELLSRNALWGGMLVFATLVLLLATRVAMWVTVGLIVSLLGTLAFMRVTGMTLNFLTMFGLIIVLGLLVDDAIVVAENIKARHERGEPALKAAVGGTHQVGWPVVVTVLTTICAFLPLRLIEGQIGDLMGALPMVVICALLVSLLESLFILPSHMAHSLANSERGGHGRAFNFFARVDAWRTQKFRALSERFGVVLAWCLNRRYLTLTCAVAALIVSLGMVAGGRVQFVFLESADSETVVANLRMPVGTPVEETARVLGLIERATMAAPEVSTVFALVGTQQDPEGFGGVNQSHIGQLFIELLPIEERDRSSDQVVDAIRASLGDIPGVRSLRFEELQGGPGGPGITYTIVGERPERIEAAALALAEALAGFEGVHSISNDADRGQRELRLTLRPGASELGFTTEQVALQARGAVFGIEAHTFAGNREDVDVRVMFDEASRRSLAAIETMHVFSPAGVAVPLSEIVEVREEESFAAVRRLDRRRAITVSADVFSEVISPEAVTAQLAATMRQIERDHPGTRILPRGRQKEMKDAFASLPLGMLAAVGMIYVILAWLFASYLQPLLVLSAVPFAMIGVIWAHYMLGFNITLLSLIGFIALTGVVVNDSLILTEFYNHKRAEGLSVYDALVAAGVARLRAIMLTTMTTFLGLSPLMAEQSFQARFLIPMAITISFGLLSATVVILIVLPCILLIAHDVKRAVRWLWHWGDTPAGGLEPPAPALAHGPDD